MATSDRALKLALLRLAGATRWQVLRLVAAKALMAVAVGAVLGADPSASIWRACGAHWACSRYGPRSGPLDNARGDAGRLRNARRDPGGHYDRPLVAPQGDGAGGGARVAFWPDAERSVSVFGSARRWAGPRGLPLPVRLVQAESVSGRG
ncbi:hypothetical protein ACMA1D_11775 [Streptomyces sp. 796.1]|uniref:hypothetical protein n=1 Tax=Streptomyces sp. 796.1 TaxID=3163029 RepID=UPI0039C9527A